MRGLDEQGAGNVGGHSRAQGRGGGVSDVGSASHVNDVSDWNENGVARTGDARAGAPGKRRGLAIVPARAGSKGLPDKNIRELGGLPLLAHTVRRAVLSGCYERVHLSTDSEAYAEIGRAYGADVRWLRSPDAALSGDGASSWDVARWVLEQYEARGESYDYFTLLQPTSPFRTVEDIQASMAYFLENDYPAVISVCEMEHSPLWANTLPEDRSMRGFVRPEAIEPRQSFPTYYRLNGAIYHVRREELRDPKAIYNRAHAYIMPIERSVDIDSAKDFRLAEFLWAEDEGQRAE